MTGINGVGAHGTQSLKNTPLTAPTESKTGNHAGRKVEVAKKISFTVKHSGRAVIEFRPLNQKTISLVDKALAKSLIKEGAKPADSHSTSQLLKKAVAGFAGVTVAFARSATMIGMGGTGLGVAGFLIGGPVGAVVGGVAGAMLGGGVAFIKPKNETMYNSIDLGRDVAKAALESLNTKSGLPHTKPWMKNTLGADVINGLLKETPTIADIQAAETAISNAPQKMAEILNSPECLKRPRKNSITWRNSRIFMRLLISI